MITILVFGIWYHTICTKQHTAVSVGAWTRPQSGGAASFILGSLQLLLLSYRCPAPTLPPQPLTSDTFTPPYHPAPATSLPLVQNKKVQARHGEGERSPKAEGALPWAERSGSWYQGQWLELRSCQCTAGFLIAPPLRSIQNMTTKFQSPTWQFQDARAEGLGSNPRGPWIFILNCLKQEFKPLWGGGELLNLSVGLPSTRSSDAVCGTLQPKCLGTRTYSESSYIF